MRIAINTRLLLPGKLEGIGWFTFETLRRMAADHPEHEFIYLFDRNWDEAFITSPNIRPVKVMPQARRPVLYRIWFDLILPRVIRRLGADVFLSPDGFLPKGLDIPSLIVIHDLNFEHYPEALPSYDSRFYRKYFPRYAREATRITTVSEFSRQDICEQYGIAEDKIDVVHNGVHEGFGPLQAKEIEAVRKKISNGRPYFIFIGAQHPRKNLSRLFLAYNKFRNSGNDAVLVITGHRKYWTNEISQAYESVKHKEDIVFTGRLEPEELQQYLAASTALTYISYFEGFGIPILEAFSCKVPVITSNVTSMPEVAGDAALLIDPFDVDDIAHAMTRLVQDEGLRESLGSKGQERVKLFSWEKSAEKLWNSLIKSLK